MVVVVDVKDGQGDSIEVGCGIFVTSVDVFYFGFVAPVTMTM